MRLCFMAEEPTNCTYNVILWRVRLMFVPRRLPDGVLLQESAINDYLVSPSTRKRT